MTITGHQIQFAVRSVIALALCYLVYTETGIYTALTFLLIFMVGEQLIILMDKYEHMRNYLIRIGKSLEGKLILNMDNEDEHTRL